MKIMNLTPHDVVIVGEDGSVVKTFPSTGLARLSSATEKVGEVDGVPITKTVFGAPEGLPDPVDGVLLIVSQTLKSAFPDRHDLVVPSELVRDSEGRVIGCRSLGI